MPRYSVEVFGELFVMLEHVPPKCEVVWRDMLQHIDLARFHFAGKRARVLWHH